jgi:hypothetical protein
MNEAFSRGLNFKFCAEEKLKKKSADPSLIVSFPCQRGVTLKDLIQDQEDGSGDQLVQADARESTRLQKLIIRPRDE